MADDVPTAEGEAGEAKDETLLRAIEGLVRRGDELYAQHVAELGRTIAGLHEVLRDVARAALKLADMPLPSDPVDAAAVTDAIERARKVMEFLEPPSH